MAGSVYWWGEGVRVNYLKPAEQGEKGSMEARVSGNVLVPPASQMCSEQLR